MFNLFLSPVTNTWGTYALCVNRSDSFCFTYCMGLKNKSKHFSKHASKATLSKVNVHQIIQRLFEAADDSSVSCILSFSPANLRTTTSQFAVIPALFFPCPGSAAWSAVCLWWNECFTNQYKPGQWQEQLKSYTLRAPNGLTLQFPPQREIGRTEVGIIKTTSPGN